jgi:hypothetical protein
MHALKNALMLLIVPILVLPLAAVTPAYAGKPNIWTTPVDYTDLIANPCGFDITEHVYGTYRWQEWKDAAGQFTVHQIYGQSNDTWSANGKFQDLSSGGQGHYASTPDGTGFTVQFIGTDLIMTLPGHGRVYGQAGNLAWQFTWAGDLVAVTKDAGAPFIANWDAICGYFAL